MYWFLFLFLFQITIFAQITYEGPAEGSVSSGIILNTEDFSLNTKSSEFFHTVIESEPEKIYQNLDLTDLPQLERSYFNVESTNNGLADSLIIFQSFEGIPQTNYNPPDDYIAAGPNHLVMVVNNYFSIYDKIGNLQKTINAAEWYSYLVAMAAPVDPKTIYDHFDNRWVMVWVYIDHIQLRSYYLISVSDDDNPNGVWFNWALPSNVNGNTPSNNWADYEGVGFDDEAIYITSNQFSFSSVYNYVKLRILAKNNIYINSNPVSVSWTDFWNISVPGNSNSASYLRPSRMYEAADEFYLFYLPNAGGNFCAVYKIINPLTNPELSATALPLMPYAIAPDAKQLGSSILIQGGFSALRNEPIYKDGVLHAVHSIRNPTNDSLSSLHYLAVDPVHNVVLKDVAIGDHNHYFFYPALSVDKNHNVIVSYSRSSASDYVGGYFTVIPERTGVPTASIRLIAGTNYFNRDNGTGSSRWGDYSGAWLDPADSLSLWICTEYVHSLHTWGTWIGGIRYEESVIVEGENEIKSFDKFSLSQNYPNPFNPSTSLQYAIGSRQFVSLKVYDLLGREVATLVNEEKPPGEYEIEFNSVNLPSGIYFYQLNAGEFSETRKMVLLK
jgi:hypothetical protein